MKKFIILALALTLVGGAAYANFWARDNVPAATLLIPYILVDVDANGVPVDNGNSTITVVTNVSSAKQIIHISVFSADSVPVIDFDEVLSGYDVWQINWRDLITGHFDYFDTGAPSGGFWDGTVGDPVPQPFGPTANNWIGPGSIDPPIDFDAKIIPLSGKVNLCGFPWGAQTQYHPLILQGIQAPLFAIPSQDTNCDGKMEIAAWGGWLSSLTDAPLFFYAYIDTVYACSQDFAGDQGYWSVGYGGIGAGIISEANVLMGNDFYLNPGQNFSESLPAVAVEAWNDYYGTGLYSELKAPSASTDMYETDREPLPTAWAFNFLNNSGITTEVGVWKNYDDFVYNSHGAVIGIAACLPYIYYAFDENELGVTTTNNICPSPYGSFCLTPEPNVFPFQTQKVAVTPDNFDGLPTTGAEAMGWFLLVFDPSIPNLDRQIHIDEYLQTYVFAKYNWGTYTTSVEATVMSNYWYNSDQMLPYLDTWDGSQNLCPNTLGVHADIVCEAGVNFAVAH